MVTRHAVCTDGVPLQVLLGEHRAQQLQANRRMFYAMPPMCRRQMHEPVREGEKEKEKGQEEKEEEVGRKSPSLSSSDLPDTDRLQEHVTGAEEVDDLPVRPEEHSDVLALDHLPCIAAILDQDPHVDGIEPGICHAKLP